MDIKKKIFNIVAFKFNVIIKTFLLLITPIEYKEILLQLYDMTTLLFWTRNVLLSCPHSTQIKYQSSQINQQMTLLCQFFIMKWSKDSLETESLTIPIVTMITFPILLSVIFSGCKGITAKLTTILKRKAIMSGSFMNYNHTISKRSHLGQQWNRKLDK